MKKSNYVSKIVDGVYTLTIKGNTIQIHSQDGYDGIKIFSDKESFDIGKGFWNCFKQIKDARKRLHPGDRVKVVDPDCIYDNYWQWFDSLEMVKGYTPYANPDFNRTYTVARVAPHNENPNHIVVAITDGLDNYYLIKEEGLERVQREG